MDKDDGLRRFDVLTATHDDLKAGRPHRLHHIVVSADEFPTYGEAATVAAQIAACLAKGMPTAILPVI